MDKSALRPAVIVFAFCILSVLAARCYAAETFFGIELGAPFAVRECTREDFLIFDRPIDTCTSSHETSNHPWGAITHFVHLVDGVDSRGIDEIVVTEFEGVVVNIGAVTFGEKAQAQVLTDLVKKFGRPDQLRKSPMQNGFGATFLAMHARWKKPGLRVKFEGILDTRDSGEIDVSNDGSIREDRAAEAWREKAAGSKM